MASMALEARLTRFGREQLGPRLSIPRHRHEHGYIAVVLGGAYQEAGNAGRFNLVAGDVAVHRAFDAHLDHVGERDADVLNLPLPAGMLLPRAFKIDDPDEIARAAERDLFAAALSLVPAGVVAHTDDWPDQLATDLAEAPAKQLRSWAHANGVAAETLSRRFRKAYGVTPAAFRAELRAHRAFALIRESEAALASIAVDCGFADQPHLTRAIVRLTGHPPGFWRRRSIPFKTGGNPPR
jgi:AraC-like DNA-binding protein